MGEYSARVRASSPGVAELVLDEPSHAGGLDGALAVLVAIGDREVDGHLEMGRGPGHVRFLVAGAEAAHRREWARVAVERPALLVPERLNALWRARTRDLGVGGALLEGTEHVPLGARVELRIELGDEDEIWTPARIIRAPRADLRAIQFPGLSDGARRRLADFVALEHVRRLGGD